jgi:4-amino-4-deoxy-L-arabinose transferase-like glycosyltransferase
MSLSGKNSDRSPSLGLILLLFFAVSILVGPFREAPLDDDWAYAETVKHLLETGNYRLNGWLSANTPLMTGWGVLFCLPGGFSFAALRVSTLALGIIGLAAFRALAVEHRIGRQAANLLTLCIATSPLYFKLSLTYMSDVPFATTVTAAILLYSKALRLDKWPLWLGASLCGGAAVLTRQFGVALLGALAVVWLIDPHRIQRLARYLVGAVVPCLACYWQLNQGWNHPNWAAINTLHREKTFLWGTGFLRNVPWRPFVILEYSAWLLIPLVVVVGLAAIHAIRDGRFFNQSISRFWNPRLLLPAFAGLFAASVAYGARIRAAPPLMPFLPWNFELLKLLGLKAQLPATLIAVLGGALFASILIQRDMLGSFRSRELGAWFLDATAFFLLGFLLVFYPLGDEYLLVLLPYVAIAIGKRLESQLLLWRVPLVFVSIALLVGGGVWTREGLCRNQAIWTLAERLHARGVPTQEIFAGWEWAGYYHFADYAETAPPGSTDTFADFFERWMGEFRARAVYLIVHDPHAPPGEKWETVDRFRYFSVFSRGTETFYAVRRIK